MGEDLDDAGRHGAGADDADLRDVVAQLRLARVGRNADRGQIRERRRGLMQRIAGLSVESVQAVDDGCRTKLVDERQRADRVAAAEAHGRVDVVAGGVAAGQHGGGVVQVREKEGARDLGTTIFGGNALDDLGHAVNSFNGQSCQTIATGQ